MRAVDLFSGAGGFTTGAELAGARVVWAANHWAPAVDCHAANHPHVEHALQDLRQADFSSLPEFDLLLAAPACQGHSEASQPRRRPKHDADRATAWAVIDCADVCRPRAIIVENVPNFRRWELFPVWRSALETLGYKLTQLILNAAEFGVPQERRRLFIVGLWERRIEVRPTVRRHVAARTCLDLELADGWAPVESKPIGVRKRVALGRERFGRTFLVQHVSRGGRRSLDQPFATITAVRSHWHLVDGDMIRQISVRELARAQSFDDGYIIPDNVTIGTRLVGNAVPPKLAAAVVRETMEAA